MNKNETDWAVVNEFGGSTTYVDRASIARNGALVQATVRYALSPPGIDQRNGKSVKEMLMLEEYDTFTNRFRIHGLIFKYADTSSSEPLSTEPEWSPATAGNQITLEFLRNFISRK